MTSATTRTRPIIGTTPCGRGHPPTVVVRFKSKIVCRLCAAERHQTRLDRIRAERVVVPYTPAFAKAPVADLIWAAGLFEGEGTITLTGGGRRPYTRVIASVDNTDHQVIEFFQQRWPASKISERIPSGSGNARLVYAWRLTSRRACEFIEAILPHIRTTRVRAKALLALQVQASKRRGIRSQSYRDQQTAYLLEMRGLNARGIRQRSMGGGS